MNSLLVPPKEKEVFHIKRSKMDSEWVDTESTMSANKTDAHCGQSQPDNLDQITSRSED